MSDAGQFLSGPKPILSPNEGSDMEAFETRGGRKGNSKGTGLAEPMWKFVEMDVTILPSGFIAPKALIARLESGEVFKRDDVVVWKCQNCGHLHIGKEAPEVCPVCAHPRSYFVQQVVNY